MARPADIAELQQALERCCADLAASLAAAAAAADGAGDDIANDGAEGEDTSASVGQWRPLILAPLPGLDMLISIVKPPLQVIVALLKVIAALLDALAAIMIGIPDIFRALILAAYALLQDIITDLLNTGAYMYIDAPGITPTEVGQRETGFFQSPAADWKAGRELKPPPPAPDGFSRWAGRFVASFDDPGDPNRPIITEGAPVQAVFIVMAAPSPKALRQLVYLLGQLFNIDKFKLAFEKYDKQTDDPRRDRARQTTGVPPDWRSVRLRDLFPALEGLLLLPEAIKGLLTAVDNLSGLIKNLAAAMHEKANLLLQIAAAIQAIIDLLDALKTTGMYSLGVATQGGVAGLQEAFLTARNRPPGGYVGGVCFLASGPNLAKASMLFDLLGGTTAIELAEGKISLAQAAKQGVLGEAAAVLERAAEPVKDEAKAFKSTVEDEANAFVDAVANAPADFYAQVGQVRDELVHAAENMRSLAVETIENAGVLAPDAENIKAGMAHTKQAQRSGARSLALGYGTHEPEPPESEPEEPPRDGGGSKP